MFHVEATFPFEATIPVPGGTRVVKLLGQWMTRSAFVEVSKAGIGKPAAAFLGELLAGWDDAEPYSAAALAAKLEYAKPEAGMVIYQAYRDELLGAEAKNSKAPRDDGSAAPSPEATTPTPSPP